MSDLELSCVGIAFFLVMGFVLLLCLFFDDDSESEKDDDVHNDTQCSNTQQCNKP